MILCKSPHMSCARQINVLRQAWSEWACFGCLAVVLDGGALEVRNIRTYPGTGIYTEIGGVRVHLRVGTVARVELGGSLSMVG